MNEIDGIGRIDDLREKFAFVFVGKEKIFAPARAFFPKGRRVDNLLQELSRGDKVRVKATKQKEKSGCEWIANKIRLEDEWEDEDPNVSSNSTKSGGGGGGGDRANLSRSSTGKPGDDSSSIFRMLSHDEYKVARVVNCDSKEIRVEVGEERYNFPTAKVNFSHYPNNGDYVLITDDLSRISMLVDNDKKNEGKTIGMAKILMPEGVNTLKAYNYKNQPVMLNINNYCYARSIHRNADEVKRCAAKDKSVVYRTNDNSMHAEWWFLAESAQEHFKQKETIGVVYNVADTIVFAMSTEFGSVFIPGGAFGNRRKTVLSETVNIGDVLKLKIVPQKEHNKCSWIAQEATIVEKEEVVEQISPNKKSIEFTFTDKDPLLGTVTTVTPTLATVLHERIKFNLTRENYQHPNTKKNLTKFIKKDDLIIFYTKTQESGEIKVRKWFPVIENTDGFKADVKDAIVQTGRMVETEVLELFQDELPEILQDYPDLYKRAMSEEVFDNKYYRSN